MAFSIEFVDEPDEYPGDDQTIPAAVGRIVIGNWHETFLSTLGEWNREKYHAEWKQSLQGFVNGDSKALLVTEYVSPEVGSHLVGWILYRGEEDKVYIQNLMLFYKNLPSAFSVEEASKFLEERQTHGEDGTKFSEWQVTLREVEFFFYRVQASEIAFPYRGEYDENLPLPKRLTEEQYRRVIFRPDAHYVEGSIVSRELGDRVHSAAVGALIHGLYAQARDAALACCISLRLQTSANRIRVCDFVLLKAGAPYEKVPTQAPLLCVEVLSPSQQPEDELECLTDYLNMGVSNIWLIDPSRRSAFTFDATGLRESDPTQLKIPGTSIHLDLTEAFAAID